MTETPVRFGLLEVAEDDTLAVVRVTIRNSDHLPMHEFIQRVRCDARNDAPCGMYRRMLVHLQDGEPVLAELRFYAAIDGAQRA